MACYYTGSAEGDAQLAAKEANGKLTEATRLLCEACLILEHEEMILSTSKELQRWWNAHKKVDRERQERERIEQEKEALKQSALSKLSDDEKKALGL